MAAPDPEQVRLRDIALDSLRAEERGQPVLAAAARGMLNWLAGLGSRPAIRAAVPLYLRDRGITIHTLAAVTGGDALRAGPDDPDGFTVRFLETVEREAADGRDRLLTVEREWRAARLRVRPPRRRPVEQPAAGGGRSAGRLAAAQHLRSGRGPGLLGRGSVPDARRPGPTRGRRRGHRSDRAGRPAALRP